HAVLSGSAPRRAERHACEKVAEGSMCVSEHVQSCAARQSPNTPGAWVRAPLFTGSIELRCGVEVPDPEIRSTEVRRAGKGSSANGFARPARMSTVADPRPASPSVGDIKPLLRRFPKVAGGRRRPGPTRSLRNHQGRPHEPTGSAA